MPSFRVLLVVLTLTCCTSVAAPHGESLGPRRDAGDEELDGAAEEGFDARASDTSTLPGPGAQAVTSRTLGLLAVCPSVLIGSDRMPIAICTQLANQTPAIYLLDAESGATLAMRELAKGKLRAWAPSTWPSPTMPSL
jgi:hypothetical protein